MGRLSGARTTSCRGCGNERLEVVLSLGAQPLANALRPAAEVGSRQPRYPLDVAFCDACGLAQLTVSIDPATMFTDYAYFSSYAPTVVENARQLVTGLVAERDLGPDDLAMEIASNDGYLLEHYRALGVPVLGIDPARNVADVAVERGIPTVCDFFGVRVAEELRSSGQLASVLHANNVLAHVPDISGVLAGAARVLRPDGRFVIETPYVRDLVDAVEFDTIYHEHLFYYSMSSLRHLLAGQGLDVVDVERIPIHGGSLRVTASLAGAAEPSESVEAVLAEERRAGVDRIGYYRDFGDRVDALCTSLRQTLAELRAQGRRVAGYGAAAKTTVLLNALGVDHETIDFVVDRNPHKHDRLVPGTSIPISPVERLLEEQPDDTVLFVWNFADEVLGQQAEYRARGGRFLVPVPEPRFV